MLKRLDDLIGSSLDVVTCDRGHRMSHGQRFCQRCSKPGAAPVEEWLGGAWQRLDERAKSDPLLAERLTFSRGYQTVDSPESIGLTDLSPERNKP